MAIDRAGVSALIPEDVSREIIQGITERSAVFQLGRRLPNMSRAQQRIPVLSTLPSVSFVTGDTGRKSVTQMAWSNKYLDAEELAVIVPVPEAVYEDADYDLWAEVRPRIEEAVGAAIDAAIFYGVNAPNAWPDDLLTAATAAGNTVALGTGSDVYDDIMGIDGVIAKVEEDGYMVNGHAAAMGLRAQLRSLRDSNTGVPIFNQSVQGPTRYELDGSPIFFPRNGVMDPDDALLFSGDFTQLVYAMRTDIQFKIFDQGIIQDTDESILHNLMQEDMIAMRVRMRLAWQVPNPINLVNNTSTRFPFAVLTPADAGDGGDGDGDGGGDGDG